MTAGMRRGRIHTFGTRRTVLARMELFLGPLSTVAGEITSSSLTSTSFAFETLLESPGNIPSPIEGGKGRALPMRLKTTAAFDW